MLKEDCQSDYARKLVRDEVEHYKAQMDRAHTQYRILEEHEQPDGSIIVKVMKQYNTSPVGEYFN